MTGPWNLIYSQQNIAPPSQKPFRAKPADPPGQAGPADACFEPVTPMPLSAEAFSRKAAECSAFVDWIPAAVPETPAPPDDVRAEPASEAYEWREACPCQPQPLPEEITPPCAHTPPSEWQNPPCGKLKRRVRCSRRSPACGAERPEDCGTDPDADTRLSPDARGFLYFKKWWFLRRIGVSVNGKMLCGIPIFIRRNTLRVVNDTYSYIIPIRNVDYIRTCDGLRSIAEQLERDSCCN